MSSLLINDVPIECINSAAIQYQVPAIVIISVLQVEGGRVGTASRNSNGTYDYGPMQINSTWLNKIQPYGYTKESPQIWRGIANYHSYTPKHNIVYQYKVHNIYQLLAQYLASPNV
jgi:hypothetical protein